MAQHFIQAHRSCLRRYLGRRVNLFRAMHDVRFHLADDRSVLAARSGDFALAACISFDEGMGYYYVLDCSWYRSDLSRLDDEDIPDSARDDLLHQFLSVVD